MMRTFLVFSVLVFIQGSGVYAQPGAGIKSDDRHQAYIDSIKNSNYKWTFPIFGKRLSKKGFDIPYPGGVMINVVTTTQSVEVSELEVGINDKPKVPLNFIEFGNVNAKVQTIVLRPDLWVFPFLNIYGLFGICKAQTNVSINEPFQLQTEANFRGHSLGFGTTLAGGYHRFIIVTDFNLSWTSLENIEGSTFAKLLSVRPGMNFRMPNNPAKSIAFWVGAQGVFVNRTTEGTIDLKDLTSHASKQDLESIINETAAWYQALTPGKKEVVKALAEYALNKINGTSKPELIVSYSLVKKPTSNWNMIVGGQFQFNHHWQARLEAGFLGGKKTFMLSGNYRFR